MRIVKIMMGMMPCDMCDGLQDAIGTKHYMLLIRADLFGPSSIPGGGGPQSKDSSILVCSGVSKVGVPPNPKPLNS